MSEPTNTNQNNDNQQTQQSDSKTQPTFDYEKLASIINGKQSVTEETVLKSYFKQQGLSADEMTQAISAFKAEKVKNTPDINKLQNDIISANNAKLQAEINQSATIEAVKQGVDVKSIPYVLKMADFKDVADTNGNVNADKLTEAVKKVLEDVPALKGMSKNENGTGFDKIGGNGTQTTKTDDDVLRNIFGIKK